MTPTKRLQVVHRSGLLRECLTAVLTGRDFEVTGVDPAGPDYVSTIESVGPDVVLIDVNLPPRNGVHLVQHIRQRLEGTKVLVLAPLSHEAKVAECIMAGAHGSVTEDASVEELRAAIERVIEGRAVCSADMIHSLYVQFANLARESHLRRQLGAIDLTGREREILTLISRHLGNKQIAKQLRVSTCTVKNHVHNILEKLQVDSRFEAVEYARQRQWLCDVPGDP